MIKKLLLVYIFTNQIHKLLEFIRTWKSNSFFFCTIVCLGNHGTGSGGLVLPVGRKLTGGSVVTGKTVDSGFNQNETEFRVLVLAVLLQMLTDLDGLLDKHVKILGDLRGKSVGLEDANNLLASDGLDLSDTIGITENDTNLRRSQTLLGELTDVVLNICVRDLKPRRGSALVGLGALGDTLSWCMHTTHAVERRIKKGEGLAKSDITAIHRCRSKCREGQHVQKAVTDPTRR
jgi:hypothetical protein